MEEIQKNIEAIIFAAENPVKVDELLTYLNKTAETPYTKEEIEGVITVIADKYSNDLFPFELGEVGGGYQLLTKADYHVVVSAFLNRNTVKRLTTAALESLAIIAYKQPVTRNVIETIRGVNADYTIQKLMEKELIELAGRSSEPGKPLLYKTTQQFLDHFGINSLDELPKLKEFEELQNQIGEKENIENTNTAVDVAQQN
ncbi:MAG: chromosome segregation and condensation protein ScpB [Bacteroidota bacterium]|nr:chromosome segregation and condensation protein ScpB [Bacteroidota bacterium]